jgi:hypothetical protein
VKKVRVVRGRSVVSGLLVVKRRDEGDRRRVVNIWLMERREDGEEGVMGGFIGS